MRASRRWDRHGINTSGRNTIGPLMRYASESADALIKLMTEGGMMTEDQAVEQALTM